MKQSPKLLAVLGAAMIGGPAVAQVKVGLTPATIDPSSVLELEHPNKALYLNRVALTSTTDVTTVPAPKAGMVVYNTNTAITGTGAFPIASGGAGVYYYNGSAWVPGSGLAAGNFWSLKGNTGTNPATDFLGTADNTSLALRSNNIQRAIFRADGTIAMGNDAPVYADNKAEFRLENVGGSVTNGEQNQGLNVLGTSLNGSGLSIAVRGRMSVPTGSTATNVRGVSGAANVEGSVTAGATGGYFNAGLKSGGTIGGGASLTGVAADAEASSGAGAVAATNNMIGGRFGADATNAAAARATGVFASANNSSSSNVGVMGLSNDPTFGNYAAFAAGIPTGFGASVLGLSGGTASNNQFAGYFQGNNTSNQSTVIKAVANPGNNLPAGREIFAAQAYLQGSDASATATSAQSVFRAQVSQAVSDGNNVRVQGSLNEAASGGRGLGQFNQPAAVGATGFGRYQGSTGADANDFVVGLRGATTTGAGQTNALNVVGSNAGGTFDKSVGGYFAPTNGATNVGSISQVGGSVNQGWKDADLTGKNVAVAAMAYGNGANDHAIISKGRVQLANLKGTGATNDAGVLITDAAGNVSSGGANALVNVSNGISKNGTTGDVQLGGPLNQATDLALNGNALTVSNTSNAVATFRNDGSIALGNSAPIYSDNKLEVNLKNVGGTVTSGEQNQGLNVLATSLNGSALSIAARGRINVAAGATVTNVRGISGAANIEGSVTAGATGGYFNAGLKSGATMGANAILTGVAADAEVSSGAGTSAATNNLIGGRFGASAANATAARATGVFTAASSSATSNVGLMALSNDPSLGAYATFLGGAPVGFGASVLGLSGGTASNNQFAGYFQASNTSNQSSVLKAVANPGNSMPAGREIFAAQAYVQGADASATATATQSVFRAQVSQAVSDGNNVRVQGSLNEAASGGRGLGQFNQPAAVGATGFGRYQGSTGADANDYVVGVRGATTTGAGQTNALNIVGSNAGGSFNKSVGGYFAPTNGATNVGSISQVGGAANDGWKDADLTGKNIAVVALNYNPASATERAIYSEGAVQMAGLTGTGELMAVDNSGNLSKTALANGSGIAVTGTTVGLGGSLAGNTDIATGGNSLTLSGTGSLGIGTSTPNATLQINGSVSAKVRSITTGTSYVVAADDYLMIFSGTFTAPRTVTLPAAAVSTGRILVIKNISGGTPMNITPYVNLNGTPNVTTINAGRTVTLVSDGADWQQISEN